MRSSGVSGTRTLGASAVAIQPCFSSSFQGTSYFFGPISEKTSFSRPSSRTRVAVRPEPPAGLDLGGDAEDRRGQQVDLVVDDQAPVVLGEELEVRELAHLARLLVHRRRGPVGEHLVGRDGDGLISFLSPVYSPTSSAVSVVLSRISADPLAHRDRGGRQDQRVGLRLGHRADADDGLARAAGQHDHAAAAVHGAARPERR